MSVESATYINELDETSPDGASEYIYEGDNHIRVLKSTIKASFPYITGEVIADQSELNLLEDFTYLGTAAARDAGSAEGNVCLIGVINNTAALPALDGSRLTGVATTDTLIAEVQLQQLRDGFYVTYFLSMM